MAVSLRPGVSPPMIRGMTDLFVALAVAFALAFVMAGPKARPASPPEARGAEQTKKGG